MSLIKENILNKKIIIWFLLITPIIDLLNGFFEYVLKINLSPGLFIRAALLVIIVYIFIGQKKNNYKFVLIAVGLFLTQIVINIFIKRININIISEVSFLSKIYFNVILILILDEFFNINKQKAIDYTNTIINVSLIITISLLVTRILGIGVDSYGQGEGFKGIFIGLNELTIVLGIAFPFILYKAVTSAKKLKYIIISAFVAINILMIGTKTSIVVMFIFIIFLGYYICFKNNKRSQGVVFTIGILITGVFFVVAFKDIFIAIIERQKYFFEKLDIITYLLSARDITLKNAMGFWVSNPLNIIFGVGFTEGARFIGTFLTGHGMIEMDMMDILYFYGAIFFIFLAYFLIKRLILACKILRNARSVYNKVIALTFILTFIVMNLGGHVLLSPFAGVYFAILYSLLSTIDMEEKDIFYTETINNNSKRKLYIIGPDMNMQGGIATIIKQISISTKIREKYDVKFISSISENKLKTFIKATIQALDIEENSIIHFNVASNGSFIRKYILFKLARRNTFKIIHIHGGDFVNFYDKSNFILKYFIKDMIKQADKIINVSEFMMNDIQNRFDDEKCKFVRIYNGIEVNDIYIDIHNKRNYIVFLGKLVEYKGIYDFIEVIEKINKFLKENNWEIIIAGDGEVEKVKSIIEKKSLNSIVNVVGWVDGSKKTKLLSESKILVVPSHIESFGISAVEGMLYGNVIIATDVGALPELIKDEKNGFIINKKEYIKIADKIKEVINDKKVLEEIQEENLEYAKEFSEEKMIEKFIEEYDKL